MAPTLACIMAASLILYVLLAGADYGAGLWDLFASGSNREDQKDLIANAIQPIWEANHVWLILLFVLLFSGFPLAFGAIMTALHLPILLMLTGIVLRGSSFVFRAYTTRDSDLQRACGYVFSISSCFTPFFGGVILGALSDDRVLVVHDTSVNGYLLNWLNPFTISFGLLTLSLCAFLAATYLVVEAPTMTLRRAFRLRAGIAAGAAFLMMFLTSSLSTRYAPALALGLMGGYSAACFAVETGISALLVCMALFKDIPWLARIAGIAQVSTVAIAWEIAQYPYLARPQYTIYNSIASEEVVRDIVIACIAGTLVLFPSLGLLFYVFKDKRREKIASTSTTMSS